MEFKKTHWIGMILGLIVVIISLFFINTKAFFFMIGVGILIGATPFVFALIRQASIANEKEEMFLEFTRNLVESVKTGTPISKSIINIQNKPFGVLSDHVKKLSNQISLGIPLNKAIRIFSDDVDNKTITRALTLIGQAERAGGEIGEILESVAGAVSMADKLKKERKAAISTLVVQGYIIFFVFMIIILVMQFRILPMVSGITEIGEIGLGNISAGGVGIEQEDIASAFLYLLLVQGFFSGLTIGKLSEGNIMGGVKHSFALMLSSFLVSAGASLFFG
jgi:archaellum biogenesis protein FlaJ (TadC family)